MHVYIKSENNVLLQRSPEKEMIFSPLINTLRAHLDILLVFISYQVLKIKNLYHIHLVCATYETRVNKMPH